MSHRKFSGMWFILIRLVCTPPLFALHGTILRVQASGYISTGPLEILTSSAFFEIFILKNRRKFHFNSPNVSRHARIASRKICLYSKNLILKIWCWFWAPRHGSLAFLPKKRYRRQEKQKRYRRQEKKRYQGQEKKTAARDKRHQYSKLIERFP